MFELRDYQLTAITETYSSFASGSNGVFLCLPTGAGKTVIFTEITKDYVSQHKRVCVVAHREELIKQAGKTINANGMQHGVIKARPSTFPLALVQIVSIDSMRVRELPWEPDLIILDEAHLSKANRYNTFLERHQNAQKLLVSATPVRTDGTGFDDLAQELITPATINDLIEHPDGPFLVPPKLYTGSRISEGLKSVKKTAGDYNKGALDSFMSSTQLVGDVVESYRKYAPGRKGVVFCVGIKHSKLVTEQFNSYGIKAEHIDGEMNSTDRDGVLDRLRSGETTIVTNASVLCEGWDEPSISYVGLARPTKSLALYIQQAGRGLRICPEQGKKDCVIIDHGNNVDEHGHILEERYWTLTGKGKKKEKKDYKECQRCFAWMKLSAKTCPECGFTPEVQSRAVEIQEETEFVEVNVKDTDPILREYRKLLRFAKARNRKAGWAWFRVVEKFGQERVKESLDWRTSQRLQKECYSGE